MVLKRLIVTTLGAFGMGALLAVGPVSAQQIPAPDAYGDPQACSAALAKLKDPAPDEGEVGDNGLTPTQAANLRNMAQACSGDVGGGIAKARTLYQVAAAAQEALDEAQEAYDDDDSSRNERELEEAMEAHTEAVTARDLYSGGALIYEAVYEEEAALARADAASDVYDKAEGAAEKAKESTNEVKYENYIDKLAGFDSNGAPLEFEAVQVELGPVNTNVVHR